jgi:hypothetical protein
MLTHSPLPEFVYNLRYPEEHGRDLRDPWSMRHTAIYQKYDVEKDTSVWILLQPSKACYQQLRQIFLSDKFGSLQKHRKHFWHMLFMWSFEQNWRDYINFLEKDLTTLVGLGLSFR